MTACALPGCGQAATSTIRMLPRRTETPIAAEIGRALVWPGVELVCEVSACAGHRQTVRKAARLVLSETVLGDDVVTRTVKD
jgi:hypothetical protein